MAGTAVAAGVLIVLMIAAQVYTQRGPGGALSDVRVGRPAPDFDVPWLSGGRVSLAGLAGRPVALNFWATWCPPCVLELPLLYQAEARYASEGLAVVALNAGQHHEYVADFMTQQGLQMPVAIDPDKQVYKEYGVIGLPTTVWIDGKGVVRAVKVGRLTEGEIESYVALLANPTP
jgi:cytochrome c biogenesis protein CcmG/thiol:disulfide interchange protein DsbE